MVVPPAAQVLAALALREPMGAAAARVPLALRQVQAEIFMPAALSERT